jgi:hypothetical protein
MRATLTIDPDNAARLEKLRKDGDLTFKEAVNRALRDGLDKLEAPKRARKPFRTRVFDGGEPRFNSPEELKELRNKVQWEEDIRKLGANDPD